MAMTNQAKRKKAEHRDQEEDGKKIPRRMTMKKRQGRKRRR
jgi:hypothetical protein